MRPKRIGSLKNLITDISGVRVGHADDAALASGVTAVIFDSPAVAAIDVRGGGPGTREDGLLKPESTVQEIDAIALSGGSALGLDAVHTALMLNALEERGLLVRRLSKTDGRSRAVHLTPAGRKMFTKLQIVATQVEREFVSTALTQQETAQLISLMTRLLGDR